MRKRLIVGVVAIEAAFLALLVGSSLLYLNGAEEAALAHRADARAQLVATVVDNAVDERDTAEAHRIAREFIADGDIAAVTIRDRDGGVLAAVAAPNSQERSVVARTRQVVEDGRIVGEVEVVLAPDGLVSAASHAGWRLGAIALGLLIVSAAVTAALGAYLTRRFDAFRAAAENIGGGDFGVTVPEDGPKEFSAAAKALNAMSRRIHALHAELKDALGRQTHALDSTFAHMTQGVAIFDRDGRLVAANEAFAPLLGFSRHDIASDMTLDDLVDAHLAGVPSDPAMLALSAQCRARSWEGPSFAFEIPLPGGRILAVTRTRLPDGGFIGVHEDVTEARLAQQKLLHAAKLSTLGELATATAHELNQPLNVIRLSADTALARLEGGEASPDYLAAKLRRIAEFTVRAAAIIDHMRVFGRKPSEAAASFDLGDAVRSAAEFFVETARRHGCRIEIEAPAGIDVVGHPALMEQVIANLLSNAMAAFSDKNIGEAPLICVRVSNTAAHACVEVADNAGGVAPEVLPRIFEPFFTTKPSGQGTGLGLSISHGIIKDMGGRMEVRNEKGGALFSVTLPLIADAQRAA
jgi:C4-dicarboxylate-specific signal transduction histidine kinase